MAKEIQEFQEIEEACRRQDDRPLDTPPEGSDPRVGPAIGSAVGGMLNNYTGSGGRYISSR